jgi:hypothetical protein
MEQIKIFYSGVWRDTTEQEINAWFAANLPTVTRVEHTQSVNNDGVVQTTYAIYYTVPDPAIVVGTGTVGTGTGTGLGGPP